MALTGTTAKLTGRKYADASGVPGTITAVAANAQRSQWSTAIPRVGSPVPLSELPAEPMLAAVGLARKSQTCAVAATLPANREKATERIQNLRTALTLPYRFILTQATDRSAKVPYVPPQAVG